MKKSVWNFMLSTIMFIGLSPVQLAFSDSPPQEDLSPLIFKIEKEIKMPANSLAIDKYARYYVLSNEKGIKVLVGTYRHDEKNSGIHIVRPENIPQVMDGGCSIVNVRYDVVRKVFLEVFCNGVS